MYINFDWIKIKINSGKIRKNQENSLKIQTRFYINFAYFSRFLSTFFTIFKIIKLALNTLNFI
jgi:hypothetical protein